MEYLYIQIDGGMLELIETILFFFKKSMVCTRVSFVFNWIQNIIP